MSCVESDYLRYSVLRRVAKEPNTGCWIWLGSLMGAGYGQFTYRRGGKRKTLYAHRMAYEAFVGPIKHQLHHICGLRCCANPEHLRDLTPTEHIHAEQKAQGHNYLWRNRA